MPQGLVKSANQIVVSGEPVRIELEVGANATAAKMLPGRIVIFDDTDVSAKEAGAAADGFIGVLDVSASKKESENYAVGEEAMVITGPSGIVLKLLLLANENVTRGDALVTAADGKLAKLAVGAMGAQGSPVGIALESSNVASDAEILVLWRPSIEAAAAA